MKQFQLDDLMASEAYTIKINDKGEMRSLDIIFHGFVKLNGKYYIEATTDPNDKKRKKIRTSGIVGAFEFIPQS